MAAKSLHSQGGVGFLRRFRRFQHHDTGSRFGVPLRSSAFAPPSYFLPPSGLPSSGHQRIPPFSASFQSHPGSYTRRLAHVFLPSVHSAKKGRSQPVDHRSFHPQYVPGCTVLQDGASLDHRFLHCFSDVGCDHRFGGRLLPRSGGLGLPQIPGIRGGREDICLSIPPLWPLDRPLGIHADHQTHQGTPPPAGLPFSHLLGRLLPPRPFSGGPPRTFVLRPLSPREVGNKGESQKVPSHSITDVGLLRGHFPPRFPSPFPSPREGFENPRCLPVDLAPLPLHPSPSGVHYRHAEFCFIISSSGSPQVETSNSLDEFPFLRFFERCSCYHLRSPSSTLFVDRYRLSLLQCSHVSSYSFRSPHDRCFSGGLGGCHSSPLNVWNLASRVQYLFHQLLGTLGHFSFGSALPPVTQGALCPTPFRQHHRDFLHLQPGFSSISSAHVPFHLPFGILPFSFHNPLSQTPQWFSQCPGGPEFPVRAFVNRMELGPGHIPVGMLPFRPTTGGPICYRAQSPSAGLCFSLPRPRGSRRQCLVAPVEQMEVNIPVPSGSTPSKSFVPSASLPRQGGPCGPLVCSIKLASQSSFPVSEPGSSSQGTLVVAIDQDREGIPPRPFRLPSSRVAAIREGLFSAGFDGEAADIFLLLHKNSSTRQYQAIWTKFLRFLDLKDISHDSISVATVCNFLAFEATHYGRQYRTVSGYRCALRLPILWACEVDVNCPTSDHFLRGLFNFSPPLKTKPMPLWNINVLLDFLQTSRFEPLELAPFPCLVQKTLCLLLLASGRRISEVANLSRDFQVSTSGLSLILDWVPGFTPKRFTAGFQPPCPSIAFLADDGSSDLTLCPVRAYKLLLARSSSWQQPRGTRHGFLWSHPSKGSPLSIPQLTGLFIGVVKDSLVSSGLSSPPSIGPHQMRKLAASLSHSVGQDEDTVRINMGFSSVTILRKNYVAKVPPLRVACVLPGGPFIPDSDLCMSDSD